jgi:hypothetical protein
MGERRFNGALAVTALEVVLEFPYWKEWITVIVD